MTRRRILLAASAAAGAVAAAAALPATASAHGLVGKQDLPIPRWLFAWAAVIVLVVSFVALGALWKRPRWEGGVSSRVLLRVPAVVEVLCGAVGVAVLGLGVCAGLLGSEQANENLLPTLVFVLVWVGVPFASLLLGDVFRAFNPWLAIGRAVGWTVRRIGGADVPEPIPYPERLGRWPAVVGVLGFAWLELVYADRDDPRQLAVLAIAYCAVQLVAMSLFGADAWSRRGDALGVYFNLLSRLSPLHWRERSLRLRAPLAGVARTHAVPGTVALLCTIIGSTSFDGFSQGRIWNGGAGGAGLAGALDDVLTGMGLGPRNALELTFTIGLLALIGLVAGIYALGVKGMSGVGEDHPPGELARRFAHTLVPIAFAYVVAHYFSLLAYQGQATAFLISDPLGDGSDLLGTANAGIDYSIVSATGVWYVQVAALVSGHACGLVLAHDRALGLYRGARTAVRSQYWMLCVMVVFTGLGLFLLSDAA